VLDGEHGPPGHDRLHLEAERSLGARLVDVAPHLGAALEGMALDHLAHVVDLEIEGRGQAAQRAAPDRGGNAR